MSGTTKTLRNHFQKVGEGITKSYKLKNEEFVLDIGGNDGTFLEFFKNKNIKVLNVDSVLNVFLSFLMRKFLTRFLINMEKPKLYMALVFFFI